MTEKSTDENSVGVHDLLGVAPISRAVERVTDAVVSGAEALLGRICLPAAEEFGLFLRDKVSGWRQRNVVATVIKAQPMLEAAAAEHRHAPPRLIAESLNHASWADSEEVQQMWAGLLASSCTEDGKDDSNWVFINLLGQLTAMEAAIVRFSCVQSTKILRPDGLIAAEALYCDAEQLRDITGCRDIQRIDRELDHLRTLGLIAIGFHSSVAKEPLADVAPTALALHLYVRSQGCNQSPVEYFGLLTTER